MPNSVIAKIKSARKRTRTWARTRTLWALVLVGFVVLTVAIPWLLMRSDQEKPAVTPGNTTYRLTIAGPQAGEQAGMAPRPKGPTYYLDPATTRAALERGLGGTSSLAHDRGMVFLYPDTRERCFWMKDMRFSLDIIWLNEARQITAIERDVAPRTYPETFCHTARYVVELNAGEAAKSGLKEGQTLNF